ncbi:MAG: hypothetical protein GWM92_02590 [Gemmatimonadetes bacterium]|nr:hypothetical protein [Gemmatimonadota bacterium]NIR77393.1 hypothetical protein [Gemmatimonadota bacterium]NIT85903.1 hypothetical protein [Gemmatimonadota bacterium]NIU29729.1 hypothetical protein [Gemmatimonadota bacterium]NIU34770.1 hypothetical protein [Gemmatimonadota bacterium]
MHTHGSIRTALAAAVAAGLLGALAPGAEAQERRDTVDLQELERRVEALSRELEEMRLGRDVVARADTSVLGFGPAASKVYEVQQGVSIGGYGEVLYENFDDEREDGLPSGATDQLDALRAIVYVGYKFNDRLLFNSEIEFEHGTTGQAGSASLEFAYLDYRVADSFGFRGGLLLSPMGFVNELHEPPVFLGTERPLTESVIIPTTWRENGVGFFGEAAGFAYRAYLMNALDGVGGGSSNAGGFGAGGLRGGRQKGSKALAEDLAGVGRIDYTGVLGLAVGTSLYLGGSAHERTLAGEAVDGTTLIWEGHAEYAARGLDLRGLVAVASLDEVEELNALKGLTGGASIGERLVGGYVQAGYDVFRALDTEHQLVPFVRWERVNTQSEVPLGFSADPANERQIVTLGFSWKPIPQVVGKVDYQLRSTEAGTGVDQLNLALGYLF